MVKQFFLAKEDVKSMHKLLCGSHTCGNRINVAQGDTKDFPHQGYSSLAVFIYFLPLWEPQSNLCIDFTASYQKEREREMFDRRCRFMAAIFHPSSFCAPYRVTHLVG